MTLVAYSESEDSDTSLPCVSKAAKDKQQTTNTTFRKFVSSDGHKVKVGLISSQQTGVRDQHATLDTPLLKKRRVDDLASATGFNALLPPPKHVNTKPVSLEKKITRPQIGSSFSLKTASEPAFYRNPMPPITPSEGETRVSNGLGTGVQHYSVVDEKGITKAAETSDATNKATGDHQETISSSKSTIFRPLSVARRNPCRQRTANRVAKQSEVELFPERKIADESNPVTQIKKISLFPMDSINTNAIYETANLDYREDISGEQPDQKKEFDKSTFTGTELKSHESIIGSSLSGAEGSKNSLLAIAEDLNLPESAKRQLFGRNQSKNSSISELSAINVVNFNTDREYAANEELRAAGETIQHNPVRSIAPGKHSLRQLVSSATTQKDALEEHFASGKRNRKEAGGKYGW